MSKILNLTCLEFNDKQVVNVKDRTSVEAFLNKWNTLPTFDSNVKRAEAVAKMVTDAGFYMAIVDCPAFMVQTLYNVFFAHGLFLLFPFQGSEGNVIVDFNGNPIYRS